MMVAVGAMLATAAVAAEAEPTKPFDPGAPPSEGPVVVRAHFQPRDINDIDDATERFEFTGVLSLTWQDARRAFDPAIEGVDEKIYQGHFQFYELAAAWYPQIVLVNESGLFESHGVVLRVKPDGTSTLVEIINAAAETELNLRRYPFDRHRLEATFEILGANDTEVVFEADSRPPGRADNQARVPQWTVESIELTTRLHSGIVAGEPATASTLVVSMNVQREAFFVVRLIVLPLALIVMLSWSVFWMERSSLADRISVSFIGILTSVAYQIVVSDIQPDISYMTLMHGFLNLSFFMMCATVPINLWVGALERQGRAGDAARIDRRCRWLFPATYFGLTAAMVVVTFTLF